MVNPALSTAREILCYLTIGSNSILSFVLVDANNKTSYQRRKFVLGMK